MVDQSGQELPSASEALVLWEHLRDHDPTATADLVDAYLDHLTETLLKQNPRIDPHFCITAAEDALISLFKNPDSYNPRRLPLDRYLAMSARGDLRNALAKETRARIGQIPFSDVELSTDAGNYQSEETTDPLELIENRDFLAATEVAPVVPMETLDGLSPEEARVFELQQVGERRTFVFARALGLAGLSPMEQAREVKRVKDRLKKRLERGRGKT
jgi:DNA-directed RNA polymerase specialized sigma24 family protein